MPNFHYICVNKKNEFFQGYQEAANKRDLTKQLDACGFFLGWSREEDISKEITFSAGSSKPHPEPISEAEARKMMGRNEQGQANKRSEDEAPDDRSKPNPETRRHPRFS